MLVKNVPLEHWIQLMIGGFKTLNLAWVNKIAVNGYTWLFVYKSAGRYEGRMNAAPKRHNFSPHADEDGAEVQNRPPVCGQCQFEVQLS